MRLDQVDIELLLDLKDSFQTFVVLPTGQLKIEVQKESGENRSVCICFPSERLANAWVNTMFKEFGELEYHRTIN
ncbi:MAG: hypothetical protein LBP51_06355 [Deferribacteraceae bacterium]|jgi:hypothetical protein|nr:hypothetical protein [Deferribacteraceae bacterium]